MDDRAYWTQGGVLSTKPGQNPYELLPNKKNFAIVSLLTRSSLSFLNSPHIHPNPLSSFLFQTTVSSFSTPNHSQALSNECSIRYIG